MFSSLYRRTGLVGLNNVNAQTTSTVRRRNERPSINRSPNESPGRCRSMSGATIGSHALETLSLAFPRPTLPQANTPQADVKTPVNDNGEHVRVVDARCRARGAAEGLAKGRELGWMVRVVFGCRSFRILTAACVFTAGPSCASNSCSAEPPVLDGAGDDAGVCWAYFYCPHWTVGASVRAPGAQRRQRLSMLHTALLTDSSQ